MMMTKAELIEAAYDMTGGDIKDLSLDKLYRLMTVTQFVTELSLNEIERRGELTYSGGQVSVPYICDHMIDTVLTRGGHHPGAAAKLKSWIDPAKVKGWFMRRR